MGSKLGTFLSFLLVAICIYGPNVPSGVYAYKPEVPEEVKKLRAGR